MVVVVAAAGPVVGIVRIAAALQRGSGNGMTSTVRKRVGEARGRHSGQRI